MSGTGTPHLCSLPAHGWVAPPVLGMLGRKGPGPAVLTDAHGRVGEPGAVQHLLLVQPAQHLCLV